MWRQPTTLTRKYPVATVLGWVLAVGSVLLVTACSGGSPDVTVTTATTSTVSATMAAPPATVPRTTTTAAVPSGIVSASTLPLPITIETPESIPTVGDAPAWVRSPYELDRHKQYWLGVQDDEFVLLSWRWPSFDLAIQRSTDGLDWSKPVAMSGSPSDAVPQMWRWGSGISASSVGFIGLFDTTPDVDDRFGGHTVLTSVDGVTWTEENLPEITGDTGLGGPFAVAAGHDGFAVWATADETRPNSDVLFVRPTHGDWQPVQLPGHRYAAENWVVAGQTGFIARAATNPEASEGTHYVYRVGTSGTAALGVMPTDQPPIVWNNDLLTSSPYDNVPRPALYVGSDGSAWYRLPAPDFSTDDEERFWSLDALSAGQSGITVAGCSCGEYWGFLGEAMVTITIPKDGYLVTIHGNQVTVDGLWDHPIRVDTRAWFDRATGALVVPDPDSGRTVVEVSCDEMRSSAREQMYQPELLTPPSQDLLYSPDGLSWFHEQVDELFGIGSYVHQIATAGEAVTLLVDPTGESPTPDPPGCPLKIYPETGPFEIWAATPNPRP